MQSNELQAINQLEEFIKRAEKLGKYPSNTAIGMLTALKIVADRLTDGEPSDMDYIDGHLEEIFHRQINRLNLSSASIQTYISRVRRIIGDFKKYGQDTKTFHAWKPKKVQRAVRDKSTPSDQKEDLNAISSGPLHSQIASSQKNIETRTLVWSLRPDLVIQIQLPKDLSRNDVARLKKLLDLEVELTQSKEE